MKIIKQSEHLNQVEVFRQIETLTSFHREFKFIHATLNGVKLPIGLAMKAKRAGMRKGIPDIIWNLRRGKYSGLFIEMKYGKNKLTPEQQEYFEFVSGQDYLCLVAYDAKTAIDQIMDYFQLEPKKNYKSPASVLDDVYFLSGKN